MPIAHVIAIVLACDAACPAPAARIAAMIREADALWRPRGVALVRMPAAAGGEPRPADVVLLVDLPAAPAPPGRGDPDAGRLGSIVFDADNVPAPALAVHAGAVAALVGGARWSGRPLLQWPAAVADALVGRAMGRVLAHEIGHYLLALRTHSRRGLMRAAFDARELTEPARGAFAMGDHELPRLRARLAGLVRSSSFAGPVSAAPGETTP